MSSRTIASSPLLARGGYSALYFSSQNQDGQLLPDFSYNPAFESGAHEVLHGVGPALSRVAVGSLSEQRGTHTLVTNTARRRRATCACTGAISNRRLLSRIRKARCDGTPRRISVVVGNIDLTRRSCLGIRTRIFCL